MFSTNNGMSKLFQNIWGLIKLLTRFDKVSEHPTSRLYFYCTLCTTFVILGLGVPLKALLTPMNPIANIILLALGLFTLFLHMLARMGKEYPIAFICIVSAGIQAAAFFSGGIFGPDTSLIFINLGLSFVLIEKKKELIQILAFQIGVCAVLYILTALNWLPYYNPMDKFFDEPLVLGGGVICLWVLFHQYYETLDARAMLYRKENERLLTLYSIDSLTKLYNRGFFDRTIGKIFGKSRDLGTPVALILSDIDFFKKINDNFGHNVGDQALIEVSDLFKTVIRKTDYAIRYGGEEFLLIIIDSGLEEAIAIAEKLKERLNNSKMTEQKLLVTMSFGVAQYANEETRDFMNKIDNLLYKSKKEGRNRISF